ncbi:MAG TPA: hypothetical protein VF647_25280 [Longimicrobium sp.]|jgi:hypothetical protein
MKIVRILPLACLICLLTACGSDSITGPDVDSVAPPAKAQELGNGTMGSGG